MTKEDIANYAFDAGKYGQDSAAGMPPHFHSFSTEEFDAFEVWVDNWNAGKEFANHAASETCDPEDRWLHEEDYLEWRDCLEG